MALINSFGNCATDLLGSAIDDCSSSSLGDLLGVGMLRPRTIITNTEATNKETWETLITESKYFPYLKLFNFEQTTPDNEIATSSTGKKRNIRDGKPEYTFTFDGYGCAIKSLNNKKNKIWDLVLIFEKGILVKDNGDDTFSGFTASYVDVRTWSIQNGTDIQSVSLMVQLDNASDFNSKFGMISYESLGFDLTDLEGALQANLKVTATAGTTVKVKAESFCNSSVNYQGLDTMSYWKVNGVAPSAVAENPTAKEYTLTVTATTAGSPLNVTLSAKTLNGIFLGSANTTVGA